MVVSFSLSHRGRRIHPPQPPPASASAHAADDWRPHGAASLDVPHPSPHPPCEATTVSRLDPGIVARSELPDRNETNPSESDLQPSFTLNLFPDGYSFGELGKGMFSYLIDDDPKKRPYSRASKALLSDIEHGCLPQDILHGISCKFQNGSTVCEVRDYRSVFSNGDDYSGDDFPRVNRVHLRLGTECVVKDLPSIANASWTYHDQLTAESIILSALQPRLNLDPTPCLEMLCNSSAKKIDLGLNKGRQHSKDTSVLIMPTDPPENCKPKEFNTCEGTILCIENATPEGIPYGALNSLSVNSPFTVHVNNAESEVKSGISNTVPSSSTLANRYVLCDRKQCASDTTPEIFFESNELWTQVEILQKDLETEPQRVAVLPQKTKKTSNLLHEQNEFINCSPPNKIGRPAFQNSKGLLKSKDFPNTEELGLGTEKRLLVEAKLGQTIGNKGMEVHKHVPLSVSPRDPCTFLNTTNPDIQKIPKKVKLAHIRSKECHVAPIADPNNSDMVDVNDCGTPFLVSFSGCSRKEGETHEDMAATKSQGTSSKRKASEISIISLNHEINLIGKIKQKVDTQIMPPRKNRSFEEPSVTGGISSQLDVELELDKERQQIKVMPLLYISASAPESYKPNIFNACKFVDVCSENADLEGRPSGTLNNSPLNYPSTVHVNNAKLVKECDPYSVMRSLSTTANRSALWDRKQGRLITPAPDNFLQRNEEQAQVTVLQVDCESRQTQSVTTVPQKRKKSLKLLNERDESKNHSPPNKSARLCSQNSKGQKSTGSSNKERLHLGSPKGLQVQDNASQTIGDEDMEVQRKVPLPVHSSCHPHTSLCTSNLCVEKIPGKLKSLHIMLNECHEDPIVDLQNSDIADPNGSVTPSVALFSANSSKAACEPGENDAGSEPHLMCLNRMVTRTAIISLNQDINLDGERQQKFNIHFEPPCENRSFEEPSITGGVSSKFGTFTHAMPFNGHPINNTEPDIEKILSEVILTTQRHGLNEKAAKTDVLETSSILPPCEFFHPENIEGITSMRNETMTCNVPDGATSTWNIKRLTFHPSQYSRLVDEPQYTLCLLESEALDHQITVGAIYGDEHIHISTLPNSSHAEKFVDQFISLMKRDGYNLYNDEVCNESSEHRQQSEDASLLGYLNGDDAEYLMFSPSAVNSLPISTNNEVGCTFQNKLPHFPSNSLQALTRQWVQAEQPLILESPEAFFFNPSHIPGGQQCTRQFLQDKSSSFACNSFATDPHRFPSVQPYQEVSVDQYLQCRDDILRFSDKNSVSRYSQGRQEALMDQCLQYRHDLPGFINTHGMERTPRRHNHWCQEVPMDQYMQYSLDIPWLSDGHGASMSTSSYSQWRQLYTQMDSVVYQWDLPSFRWQITDPLHGMIMMGDVIVRAATDQEALDELQEHGLWWQSYRLADSDPHASRLPLLIAWNVVN